MSAFDETYKGYAMDVNGGYRPPSKIETEEQLMDFIAANVDEYHELRIVDDGDNCVMHIIAKTLVFPVADEHKKNQWSSRHRKFITITQSH